MKTATLDKTQWVEILDIDHVRGFAYVMDEDGAESEVSLNRIDNIEDEILDLSPLESAFLSKAINGTSI